MSNPMSEQEIRLEIIKALIQSGFTNTLRGDLTTALAIRADPLVNYVMATGKKPAKKKAAAVANSPNSDPANSALEKNT